MNTDIFAILIAVIIGGIVIIAWRIRAEIDKGNEEPKRKPELSEAAKRRQMQASIERLERNQTEISRKLDQILEARSKTVQKTAKKTTKTTKATSKPKTKKK